jgi:hypothetical protein
MQQSLFNRASTFKSLWYFFGISLVNTTYQLGERVCTCLEIKQHGTQFKSSSSYLFWVVFNRIESSEFTEVILCMDGDVTPEEDTKPYLYQVFMVIELNISTLDKTWQWLNEYFPGYTFITSWGSEFQDSKWIQSRLQSVLFYPRVCYVYITTVLLGWPYVLV